MGKSIDDYRAKRDFTKTPEPGPEDVTEPAGESTFVVHRHEARRLHYDLRLAMAGVLKCWAVPRGFSYDPKDKRLAVHTEDHPLAYEHFEGVIPKGEYGAGTMTIWDRGRYRVVNPDGLAAIAEGKLEILLYGQKLRGEWHLVRTKRGTDDWLLFKAKDRYVRSGDGSSQMALPVDLSSAGQVPLPESVEPMRVGETAGAFSAPEWLFEMRFHGARVLAVKEGESVRLTRPEGVDLAPQIPEVVRDLAEIRAENALLDGVLVVLDESQRPSRPKLQQRLEGSTSEPIFFYVFDLLYYDEWDLRSLPLLDRKQALAAVLPPLRRVLYVDHVLERGEDLARATASAGLPGVVAKEAASVYRSGPSPWWREISVAPEEGAERVGLLEGLSRAPGPSSARPGATARKVKFSNLDKVFWPEEGYTKGDLIAYYDQVAEVILPYLRERPMHMNRFPDGIEGKNFYQKDAPDHLPDWIATELIGSDSREAPIRYIVCNHRETLLYLANLGSIDLHPWFSRRGSLESPDWAVLDLDPDGSPFPQVVKVAKAVGKLLRGIGLRPYLKTSGATGLHIYIPLKPGYDYEHARLFCEGVARLLADEYRDIATVDRVPARRGGRVYIDFLQNRRGQTVVPAYCARPVPGATVSTPLEWDELGSDLDPGHFTIKTVPARLARLGDLFRPTLTDLQDLLPAIDAVSKIYKK